MTGTTSCRADHQAHTSPGTGRWHFTDVCGERGGHGCPATNTSPANFETGNHSRGGDANRMIWEGTTREDRHRCIGGGCDRRSRIRRYHRRTDGHRRRSDYDDDGNQARLTDGDVVQGWTISNLKASTDQIPYPVAGTLWKPPPPTRRSRAAPPRSCRTSTPRRAAARPTGFCSASPRLRA